MDKIGVIALIIGLILCALGGYAIWAFLPEVMIVVKGFIGIAVLLAGTVASAATMVKSTDTTVTSKGGKVVKTVTKKHFKKTSHKKVKSTAIKTTTVPTPAPAK